MKKKTPIAVFLHHPTCALDSVSGIHEALSQNYEIFPFTINDLNHPRFTKAKMYVFPGGVGEATKFNTIIRPHIDIIKEQLDKGKKYLGICMGAYWAGPNYFNILRNLDAVQYIKRPRTEIRRSHPTTANITWGESKYRMYFYDGCAIVGNGRCNVIATYKNGDNMAIIQKNVGIIGCHPESMRSWYDKSYLVNHWHKFHHHKLLQEFVEELL